MKTECNECKQCNECKMETEYYPRNKTTCKACTIAKQTEYNQQNAEKIKEYLKKYREEHPEHATRNRGEYFHNYFKNNPLNGLKNTIKAQIGYAYTRIGEVRPQADIQVITGCSMTSLLDHLNDNEYGLKYGDEGVDIDHIIPLSKAKTTKDLRNLLHYTNLQLLPAYYNRWIKRNNEFNAEELNDFINSIL